MPYNPTTLRDLILNRGNIAAQHAQNSAGIYGGAAQGLAGVAGNYFQERQVKRDDQRVQQAIRDAQTPRQFVGPMQPGEAQPAARRPDIQSILGGLPPELRARAQKGLAEIDAAGYAADQRKAALEKAGADAAQTRAETEVLNGDYRATLGRNIRPYIAGDDAGVGATAVALGHAAQRGTPGLEKHFAFMEKAKAGLEQAQQSGDPAQLAAFQESIRPMVTQIADELEMGESAASKKARAPELVEITAADGSTSFVEKKAGVGDAAKPPEPGSMAEYRAATPERRKEIAAERAAFAAASRDPNAGTRENRMWVLRDGEAAFIPESQVRPGDKPASTREQGRQVTSGDAGRLAQFDTGLSDLATLRETLSSSSSTGTAAKAKASLIPDVLTDLTGWGADAKSKQATIDLVKQVIGKTLEDGVLRKEDEIKYEKILPKLADSAQVVKSKLDGLEKKMRADKGILIENLGAASFDVSKYLSRDGGATPPPPIGGGGVSVTAPNGKVYVFKDKAAAAAFKAKAGM